MFSWFLLIVAFTIVYHAILSWYMPLYHVRTLSYNTLCDYSVNCEVPVLCLPGLLHEKDSDGLDGFTSHVDRLVSFLVCVWDGYSSRRRKLCVGESFVKTSSYMGHWTLVIRPNSSSTLGRSQCTTDLLLQVVVDQHWETKNTYCIETRRFGNLLLYHWVCPLFQVCGIWL